MSESKEDWPPLVDIQQTFALYDAGEYDDFASAAVDHLETNEDLGRYHRIVLCCMMVDICAQANDREHYYAQAERQYEELKWYRFENDEDMYNDAGFLLKNAYDTMMRKLKEERQRDREETERLEWLEAEEINDDSDDPGSEDGDKTHSLPVRTQALAIDNKPETARTQEADEQSRRSQSPRDLASEQTDRFETEVNRRVTEVKASLEREYVARTQELEKTFETRVKRAVLEGNRDSNVRLINQLRTENEAIDEMLKIE